VFRDEFEDLVDPSDEGSRHTRRTCGSIRNLADAINRAGGKRANTKLGVLGYGRYLYYLWKLVCL
jgi:hypothetical protein